MKINQKDLPLEGKTIVLTRALEQQSQALELFNKLGAKVLEFPALIIGPPSTWEPLDNALKELATFEWIIFSSANGVNAVEARLQLHDKSLKNRPEGLLIAAVGRKTAQSLQNLGSVADFIPSNYIAEDLIKSFPIPKPGKKILLPRVESGGRTILKESFSETGLNVVEVSAYESSCPESIPLKTILAIKQNKVDAITFTSSKIVKNTAHLLGKSFGLNWREKLKKIKLISIGPETTKSCNKFFQRTDQEANPHDLEGLIDATNKAFQAEN